MFGPEHEFSINDEFFEPLPIADKIIKRIRGRVTNEAKLKNSRTVIGKELQKHVIELKPEKPFESFSEFEEKMHEGILELMSYLEGYRLLGLGMHPLLNLESARVWDHRDRRIYETYDKLFNIKQHGWLNIQSFQLNLPFKSEEEAITMHNKLRVLIPYLVAIASSSPIYEGKAFYVDSRIYFYRINQIAVPLICNDVIPEKIRSLREYKDILEKIYYELKSRNAKVLCVEWVNSRGVIFRFTRKCLEIKVMDEQECIKSDVALASFINSILREDLQEMEDLNLKERLNDAMIYGTKKLKKELRELFKKAMKNAEDEERKYLRIVKDRIDNGSLGERILEKIRDFSREEIIKTCEKLSKCIEKNEVFN
ncbi:MAG: glutamate-cysteine ligase family protein [Archaeoglobaceae archaeon]|nr:glutamate-cysteine ligase family protein [Archaeoglobaceae archaeon]MDW7989458.1 glutamate-cysteine ligase family protein [Archaeoglobaceae archaeon]